MTGKRQTDNPLVFQHPDDHHPILLPTKWAKLPTALLSIPIRIRYFDSIDSTNLIARREAESGASEGTLYLADIQTAGRGCKAHHWHSQDKGGLYFSVLLRPDWKIADCLVFTKISALAVLDAVKDILHQTNLAIFPLRIKPPNDILISGRKLCGILVESASLQEAARYIIVGIGINVNQVSFPQEISSTAISLRMECGCCFDQADLLIAIIRNLWQQYQHIRHFGPDYPFVRWASLTGESL